MPNVYSNIIPSSTQFAIWIIVMNEWKQQFTNKRPWSETYSLQLLPHETIFAHQLWHLFLKAIILLHQQLIHCCQFPVHSLESWGLFSLLLSTPAHSNSTQLLSVSQETPSSPEEINNVISLYTSQLQLIKNPYWSDSYKLMHPMNGST
jgi:hypothetical protein